MAVALVAGVLAWGGPPPRAKVDPEHGEQPIGEYRVDASVAVPLQATIRRDVDPQPQPQPVLVADPDHIGPCPKRHSPVIWQGLRDGRPTWKHGDGSITQRARQRVTTAKGEVLEFPVIVSMRPAEVAGAADSR